MSKRTKSAPKKPVVAAVPMRRRRGDVPLTLTPTSASLLLGVRARRETTLVEPLGEDVVVYFRDVLELGENTPLVLTGPEAKTLQRQLGHATLSPASRALFAQMQAIGVGVMLTHKMKPGPPWAPEGTEKVGLVARGLIEAGFDEVIEFDMQGAHDMGHALLNLTGCMERGDAPDDAVRMMQARGIAEALLREEDAPNRPGIFKVDDPSKKLKH